MHFRVVSVIRLLCMQNSRYVDVHVQAKISLNLTMAVVSIPLHTNIYMLYSVCLYALCMLTEFRRGNVLQAHCVALVNGPMTNSWNVT